MIARYVGDLLFVAGVFLVCTSAISIGAWTGLASAGKTEKATEAGMRALSLAWHAVAVFGLAAAVRFWPW